MQAHPDAGGSCPRPRLCCGVGLQTTWSRRGLLSSGRPRVGALCVLAFGGGFGGGFALRAFVFGFDFVFDFVFSRFVVAVSAATLAVRERTAMRFRRTAKTAQHSLMLLISLRHAYHQSKRMQSPHSTPRLMSAAILSNPSALIVVLPRSSVSYSISCDRNPRLGCARGSACMIRREYSGERVRAQGSFERHAWPQVLHACRRRLVVNLGHLALGAHKPVGILTHMQNTEIEYSFRESMRTDEMNKQPSTVWACPMTQREDDNNGQPSARIHGHKGIQTQLVRMRRRGDTEQQSTHPQAHVSLAHEVGQADGRGPTSAHCAGRERIWRG